MPDRQGGFADGSSAAACQLHVHFDESCSSALRGVLAEAPLLFAQSDPDRADVVIFGSDDIAYLDRSPLYDLSDRRASASPRPTSQLSGFPVSMRRTLSPW
jgi:hypothetical protein